MITTTKMAESFSRNVQIIKMQIKDLADEDCFIQLPFRANCMNWIIGHLVTNRHAIFRLLGADGCIDSRSMERYERESEPINSAGEGVWNLENLLGMLDDSQKNLEQLLEKITELELARQVAFFGNRSMSIAEWLFFFYFHETYHTGQTEILRQAAGRNDKVI